MENTFLVITSIANHEHPVLKQFAEESAARNISFIVIGDTKSPLDFHLDKCDFYSVERQKELKFKLGETLPYKHYARKNLGYLTAMSQGAETIIETDDDNIPFESFWNKRFRLVQAHEIIDKGWVNIYKYFTDTHIWPRGFALENILDTLPELTELKTLTCPIQQGLADENPDVDAIYRLILPLPIKFKKSKNIALGNNSFCPFNSQNTTWFKEAFPLMYLPSYCSFRMTDIWRSFVAQRIAWTCGWSVLFHNSTVWQQRNDHNLMIDFRDEIVGYSNNSLIYNKLKALNLKSGIENISENMIICYRKLIDCGLIGAEEMDLLKRWISDLGDYCK
ncbi:MAG TPA: STELLO glycosyltransferase family protein [Bacteroidales bacterium]|nr:STELLO glycosyltransferase family protein [Bacteroidales bacterium]